ncbi:hypothetical protein [Arcobacter vandammei]|uniref:hypothetical protein n=1 Tax=Arcobacter vandammei TaxID=2782243 RepID=UPI0018DFD772|nr:hypothetical protein [Arcobacter vandammei]
MQLNKSIREDLISSSRTTLLVLYFIRLLLVASIIFSYFYKPEWFDILVIITLIQIALFPNNLYGAFIENLVEYNTQTLEDRILLNANETNKYLIENDKFKERIEFELEIIKSKLNKGN